MSENKITIYEEKLNEMKEQIRFYISTPERFAEALIFAKKLEAFAEDIKEKVRERGSEIMSKEDLREITFGDYKVVRQSPTTQIIYKPSSVIDAFGLSVALQFLKADTTKIKTYVMKAKLEGSILTDLNLGRTEKHRNGFIKLIEVKEKK